MADNADNQQTLLFLHGMESRYGKTKPSQVEAQAKAYAEKRGMRFEAIPISGDKHQQQFRAAQERIKKGGIGAVLGFSAGGYNAAKLKTPKGVEKIIVGAPRAKGDQTFRGVSHMNQVRQLSRSSSTGQPHAGGASNIPSSVLSGAKQAAMLGGPKAVQKFMAENGHPRNGAWCGEFAAAVFHSQGLPTPKNPEVASNWRTVGQKLSGPQPGAVAVRNTDLHGRPVRTGNTGSHVSFVESISGGRFTGIGGNQRAGIRSNYPTSQFSFYAPGGMPPAKASAVASNLPQRSTATAPQKMQTVQQLIAANKNNPALASYLPYTSMIPDQNLPVDQWKQKHGDLYNSQMVPQELRSILDKSLTQQPQRQQTATQQPQSSVPLPRGRPMTQQEQYLYQHHLNNLNNGGVRNPDGSISTVRQMTVGGDGSTYNIPTVWDNKILSPEESIKRAQQSGWNNWPSYPSEKEAQMRYDQMHNAMENDVTRAMQPAGQAVTVPSSTSQPVMGSQGWQNTIMAPGQPQGAVGSRSDQSGYMTPQTAWPNPAAPMPVPQMANTPSPQPAGQPVTMQSGQTAPILGSQADQSGTVMAPSQAPAPPPIQQPMQQPGLGGGTPFSSLGGGNMQTGDMAMPSNRGMILGLGGMGGLSGGGFASGGMGGGGDAGGMGGGGGGGGSKVNMQAAMQMIPKPLQIQMPNVQHVPINQPIPPGGDGMSLSQQLMQFLQG